ncbi:hypothetical protein KKF34_14250 [Myxococcota bacterium]|nr:hypothetical protein [Myxococcota bacterium]MBU1380737.1 hypothetical protein [Myxococcota bacterium]MBU1498035.1 hypothetical protein [Myxococcota bacterium]
MGKDNTEFLRQVNEFIENLAITFEEYGIPRMAGKIFANLLVAEKGYLSARELMDVTGGSKGSISTLTRQMINVGVIEKVGVAGSRLTYFKVAEPAMIGLLKRKLEHMKKVCRQLTVALGLFEERNEEISDRIKQQIEVHHLSEEALESVIERWNRNNK